MLKYSIIVLEQDGWMFTIINKEENIDQKRGKNRCPYPYPLSIALFPVSYFFVQEIFTRACFCDFVANSQNCPFLKIKSRQEHFQNKVKEHLLGVKTTAKLTVLVLNRKSIFWEIIFLNFIHEMPFMKFAIFET